MEQRRNANIELARIVGCLMVVCLHICTWYTSGNEVISNALLIRSFLNDGVPIFWYIMGFYLFAHPDASNYKRFIKALRSLVLPAFGVMLFAQIWQDWILDGSGKVDFFSCLDMHSFDGYNLFGNLLQWKSDMTFGGHFWYVFSYMEVLLWVPLLKYVCVNEKKANRCRQYIMLLTILFVICRDINNITTLSICGNIYTIRIPTIISPTILYVLIGYEVSQHIVFIQNNAKWARWIGVVCFAGFNFMKFLVSDHMLNIKLSNTYFTGIGSVLDYLASLAIFTSILSLPIKHGGFVERGIQHLASGTLGVYLIHTCVYRKLNALGVRNAVFATSVRAENLPREILCTMEYALIVFLISYLIMLSYRILRECLCRISSKNV